jgi:hypothetical protein
VKQFSSPNSLAQDIGNWLAIAQTDFKVAADIAKDVGILIAAAKGK